MKFFWFYLFYFNLLPITIFGQSEYYAKDSSMFVGAKLEDGGDNVNSRLCRVDKDGKIVEYSPSEVNEYGFKNGRVYISKEINISDSKQKVFLERLVRGKITLYYYRGEKIKTFFLEKDSASFIELSRNSRINKTLDFRDNLKNISSDCPNLIDAVKVVHFRKKSMAKLIARYNSCELKPFPFFKYGVVIGYELVKLIPSPHISSLYVNTMPYKYNGGFTIGLFVDKPIDASDFTIHTELNFSKHGFSYYKLINNKDIDFVSNITSLKLPVLIRYACPYNITRPFINAGAVLVRNLKNQTSLYEVSKKLSTIEISNVIGITAIYKNQIGYSIGGGFEQRLNYKTQLIFELRYTKLYGLKDSGSLINSEFQFITGVNF